jgi:hypothetical protein
MAEYSKKKRQFLAIVHTMVGAVASHRSSHWGVCYETLGKAYNVTEAELLHQHGRISDKAREFILYQMRIINERPVWYEGEDINREE